MKISVTSLHISNLGIFIDSGHLQSYTYRLWQPVVLKKDAFKMLAFSFSTENHFAYYSCFFSSLTLFVG